MQDYTGGQREALIGGALFEGLAGDRDEAIAGFVSGETEVGACHDYGAVGSLAGIYTASMPVFVVENCTRGNRGFLQLLRGQGAPSPELRLLRRGRAPAPASRQLGARTRRR